MIYDVYLALGSNMGDREKNLADAVELISRIPDIRLVEISSIYETEPVGYTEQGRFLNMAASIKTDLEPLILLKELQRIENALKRTREIHWGPRTIDIDILLFGDKHMGTPELTVPHPKMLERAFVLIPLKEVYHGKEVFGKNIEELINRCVDREGLKPYK